jgi:hypothetical protein
MPPRRFECGYRYIWTQAIIVRMKYNGMIQFATSDNQSKMDIDWVAKLAFNNIVE